MSALDANWPSPVLPATVLVAYQLVVQALPKAQDTPVEAGVSWFQVRRTVTGCLSEMMTNLAPNLMRQLAMTMAAVGTLTCAANAAGRLECSTQHEETTIVGNMHTQHMHCWCTSAHSHSVAPGATEESTASHMAGRRAYNHRCGNDVARLLRSA